MSLESVSKVALVVVVLVLLVLLFLCGGGSSLALLVEEPEWYVNYLFGGVAFVCVCASVILAAVSVRLLQRSTGALGRLMLGLMWALVGFTTAAFLGSLVATSMGFEVETPESTGSDWDWD